MFDVLLISFFFCSLKFCFLLLLVLFFSCCCFFAWCYSLLFISFFPFLVFFLYSSSSPSPFVWLYVIWIYKTAAKVVTTSSIFSNRSISYESILYSSACKCPVIWMYSRIQYSHILNKFYYIERSFCLVGEGGLDRVSFFLFHFIQLAIANWVFDCITKTGSIKLLFCIWCVFCFCYYCELFARFKNKKKNRRQKMNNKRMKLNYKFIPTHLIWISV